MEDYPVVIQFPMHWGEMDALGHANHTRFLVWMETARIKLFEQVGLISEGKPSVGPILANLNVDYLAPVHYPAMLSCGVRVTRLGRTSFGLEYGISHTSTPAKLVARGTSVIVVVNYESGEKIEIPPTLRTTLTGLQRTPVDDEPSTA